MFVTVAFVWVGEAFGVEYIEHLFDCVHRNLPEGFPGRFVCLTDRPGEVPRGVEAIDVSAEGLHGWWPKVLYFKPGIFEDGERIWAFDLDTVITGPLDQAFGYHGSFAILKDVYRTWADGIGRVQIPAMQSSVMSFIAGTKLTRGIWDHWTNSAGRQFPGGDQQFLESFWLESLPKIAGNKAWPPDYLQDLYPGVFRSYKVDCVWAPPKGTSVVFFHGLPRPHDVKTGWVPEVWKVDGGSALTIVAVGTVSQTKSVANVKAALLKGYRELEVQAEHNQTLCLVGGGPSLKSYIAFIGSLQQGGAQVMALNNADGYLRRAGVVPELHCMLDARVEIHDFVQTGGIKLYASMCDPSVLRAGDSHGDLSIWHCHTEPTAHLLENKMTVGGGSTVGTHALALAWTLGYRNILCFGFDSSYADSAHHAYDQALNDADRVLDAKVGDRHFKAAAWMIQQAEDFKSIAIQLAKVGVKITLYGDGLLPALVDSLHEKMVLRDGLWWPSADTEARESILSTLPDLNYYMGLCAQHRTCVQAGANVGVWPKELAKRFEKVITAEPDPDNYACFQRNVTEGNVMCMPSAFGEVGNTGSIARDPTNCGASAVADGDDFLIVPIDTLALKDVDLLQLDVEGYEFQALKGAVNTIEASSPLIVLELKGLGERYGYSDQDVVDWLTARNYQEVGVAHRDRIFRRTP